MGENPEFIAYEKAFLSRWSTKRAFLFAAIIIEAYRKMTSGGGGNTEISPPLPQYTLFSLVFSIAGPGRQTLEPPPVFYLNSSSHQCGLEQII